MHLLKIQLQCSEKVPANHGEKNILELCREQIQVEGGEFSVMVLCGDVIASVKFTLRKGEAYSLRSIFLQEGCSPLQQRDLLVGYRRVLPQIIADAVSG